VVFALVWSSSLQLEVMISKKGPVRVQAEIMNRTNEYQTVWSVNRSCQCQRKAGVIAAIERHPLPARQLFERHATGNHGRRPADPDPTKSGLCHEAGRAKTGRRMARVVLGHPGSSTEKISAGARREDSSANPGDAVDKFKERIASQAYFKTVLNPTNGVKLISLSPPQSVDGRPYVLFNLELQF